MKNSVGSIFLQIVATLLDLPFSFPSIEKDPFVWRIEKTRNPHSMDNSEMHISLIVVNQGDFLIFPLNLQYCRSTRYIIQEYLGRENWTRNEIANLRIFSIHKLSRCEYKGVKTQIKSYTHPQFLITFDLVISQRAKFQTYT